MKKTIRNLINDNNDNEFMDNLGLGESKAVNNLTVDGIKNEENGTKSPAIVCRDKNMRGPVTNFHQIFNFGKNDGKMNELGWRKHFMRSNSKNLVKKECNFKGSGMETYLHNLENNRNVYL